MNWFELQSFRAYPADPKIKPGYPVPDCETVWRRHRFWSRWSIGLFLGWIPYGLLVILGLAYLHKHLNFPGPLVFVFIAPYALAIIVIGNLAQSVRCPRCGFRFNAWGPWGLGHARRRRCRNCGLRKWACDPMPESPGTIR